MGVPQLLQTCTTTLDYNFLTDGPTSTAYETTYTAFSSVDCGGCALVLRDILGVGPVGCLKFRVMCLHPHTHPMPP